MFFNSLRRLRPQTSIFLAAAAIAVGAACGGEAGPPDNPNPTGGTGGVTGGTATGGMTGGSPTGGTAAMGGNAATGGNAAMGGNAATGGNAAMGGNAATGGNAAMGGTASAGGNGDAGTVGGTGDAGTASMGGASDAGADSGGVWMQPNPSLVKSTGTACLSIGTPTGGKCGSYYCGVTKAILAPEINPAGVCGGDPDFACEGSLTKITTDCAVNNAFGTPTDVLNCVKMDANVKSHNVKDSCIMCFVTAADCCKNDSACFTECLLNPGTKSCDDKQKAAGCITPNFACSGLPNPL